MLFLPSMRIFISTFLIAGAVLAPSLALAQTTNSAAPPPATAGSHPNVLPPTKAPSKPLPPAPLPNGQLTVSGTSSSASGSATASPGPSSQNGGSATPIILIGAAVVLIIGIGWFMQRRKATSI